MVVRLWNKAVAWLKYAWAREPVIFMSCVFGFSGNCSSYRFLFKSFEDTKGF